MRYTQVKSEHVVPLPSVTRQKPKYDYAESIYVSDGYFHLCFEFVHGCFRCHPRQRAAAVLISLIHHSMLVTELIGNLGAAAEVVRANGAEFIKFRVADTRRWKTSAGEAKSETTWVDCIISDANHRVFPYLKVGVQVYVRGGLSARVYSSQKDRCMKCGLTINVQHVELLGGQADVVPRELYDDLGNIIKTSKWYWSETARSMQLHDRQGVVYNVDKDGFITPSPDNFVESPNTSSDGDTQTK